MISSAIAPTHCVRQSRSDDRLVAPCKSQMSSAYLARDPGSEVNSSLHANAFGSREATVDSSPGQEPTEQCEFGTQPGV